MTDRPDGPPRAALIAALVVAVAAAVTVVVIAVVHARRAPQEPLVISAVPAPEATSPECEKLLSAIPERLGDYQRADPAEPVPPATAGWQPDSGGEPIVLRCGLDRPSDFVVGSPIQVVDAVQWFEVADPAADRSTWFAVDRPVYVALTLPQGSGPTPIQQMSDVIAQALPAVKISPGPPR